MRIENCTIRVNSNSAATEVFVSNNSGVNTTFYLPPNTDIDPAQPIEFIPAPQPSPSSEQHESGNE